jgi:hypothetical protein
MFNFEPLSLLAPSLTVLVILPWTLAQLNLAGHHLIAQLYL